LLEAVARCAGIDRVLAVPHRPAPLSSLRLLLLAGLAATVLGACANNHTSSMARVDYAGMPGDSTTALIQLEARYKAHPQDKATIIYYAAALRSANQPEQAVSVLESGLALYKRDVDLKVAYAKALAAGGRFDQALNVVNDAIDPTTPDWNALLVKGAILDQSGRNEQAREVYQQAQLSAPDEASLEANIGLSYAMTNDLALAEQHLRRAVTLRGANSQVRQNLALVICLQGRFDECKAMFAKELPPAQVEANMSYVRALLTQQNRWDLIKGAKASG
jgi:Flp pilus assembly protein TadD